MSRVARALGNELPRRRLDVLQSFRAAMARVPMRDATFGAGYRAGLLDVTAEYERTVRQADGDGELGRVAWREGWREVLRELASGPRLPSELADRLDRDRSSITRILQQLRIAGLVGARSDAYDRRARPHRLTPQGRQALAGADAALSRDLERGIAIAVQLFRYLLEHGVSPTAALDAVAGATLDNPAAAAAAVSRWVEEAQRVGVVGSERNLAAGSERYRMTLDKNAASARSDQLWQGVSAVLSQRQQYRRERIPVFVRTGEEGWAAWVHALQAYGAGGTSRTIVNGDLVSGAVYPPEERFDLIYDDPAVIGSDRDEPTMQAFMARADAKFVVAASESEVPDGFIPLTLPEARRAITSDGERASEAT